MVAVVPEAGAPEPGAGPALAAAESQVVGEEAELAPAPDPVPEPAQTPEQLLERRMAEVSALVQDALACEDADPARAAVLLREAVLGCLEASEDPLGSELVCRELLAGFDHLSVLLQREGLPEEALEVVDDAASLGLLEGDASVTQGHRAALRSRREDLRRSLFCDSAQL